MNKCPYCDEETHEIYYCETCGNYGCWHCRTHCPGCHTEMDILETTE